MIAFDEEEFWKALGRIYDATVELDESVRWLGETVKTHERRLDRSEVTIEAILDDLRRLDKGRT